MKSAAAVPPLGVGSVLLVLLGFAGQGPAQKPGLEVSPPFKGHTDTVYTVAVTPDNKYLATGSFDTTVKLWDLATGKEARTYSGPNGHNKMVVAVAVSPDGTMLASGGADNQLKLWDIPVNAPVKTFPLASNVQRVALTPDATKLALAGSDKVIVVNAADFKELAKFDANAGASLSWNANGQLLVGGSQDGTLRFFNPAKNETTAVGAHRDGVNQVLIHPGGLTFSVGGDGQMRVWNAPAAPAKQLTPPSVVHVASTTSNDGQVLLLAGADKNVRHITAATAKEVRVLTGATAEINAVAINPANTLIAAAQADGRWNLWNATDGKHLGQLLAHAGKIKALAFHPQNPMLATSGGDGLVRFWAMPPVPARTAPHSAEVVAAVGTPDGKKLFTAGADQIVRIFDTAKMGLEKQFPAQSTPITAFAAGGPHVVTGGNDGALRFWNPTAGKESGSIVAHTDRVTSLSLAPSGTQLVSSGADGSIKVWQVPPVAPKLMAHPDQVICAALAPDGTRFVTGGADRIVRSWNINSGAKEREFAGPTLAITSVAISGDGRLVAAGSADKTLHLWTLADGKLLQKWTLPSAVPSVAFSPDNLLLAAGLGDASIKLFKTNDFKDPKEVKSFAVNKGAVTTLAYRAELLLAGCADKSVQGLAAADGSVKFSLPQPEPVAQVSVSKDGARVAVVAGKTLTVWTLADAKEQVRVPLTAEGKSVAWAPDGTRIAVAGVDRLVRLLQADGTALESFAHEGPVHAALVLDAKRVIGAGADKTARLWTSHLVWQERQGAPVHQAVVAPKGEVYSAGEGKVIKVTNLADGKSVRAFPVNDAAFLRLAVSPDGTRLAGIDAAKRVRVWDLTKPEGAAKPLVQLEFPQVPAAVALNQAGQHLTVAAGSEIKVIDVALGKEVQSLQDHTGQVNQLSFLADQKTLVSAGKDNAARLLNVASLGALETHPGGAEVLQFHSNDTQLLTAGADKTIKIWDVAKKAALKSYGPFPAPIATAGYSRDFQLVAAAFGKTLKIWNPADDKDVASLNHPADVLSFSFRTDKTRVVTGGADKQTRLWEVTTARELQYTTFPEAVQAVYQDPAGNFVISVVDKSALLEVPFIQRTVPVDVGAVTGVAFNTATNIVYTVGADKTIKAWSLANFVQDKTTFPPAAGTLRAISVAKTNQLLAAGGDDKTVRLFSLPDGKEVGSFPVTAPVVSLTFSPNSQMLIATLADKRFVAHVTTFTPGQPLAKDFLQPVQAFAAPHVVSELAMLADNATMFLPGPDKSVQQWKVASPNPVKTFAHPNIVDCMAFHPKSPILATGCHDGKIRLWDLVKGAVQKEIAAHLDKTTPFPIYTVAFSPDGTKVLSSSYDKTLKLYDTASGNFIREFKAFDAKAAPNGHQEEVYTAAFSPDGKLIASGSGGGERVIKIWKADDGAFVRDLPNPELKKDPKGPAASHPGWIYHVRFTRDGRLISVGDAPKNHGFLAIWNPNDGKLLASETTTFGAIFGFTMSSDEKLVAIGAGSRGRATGDFNQAYLLRVPGLNK